MENFGKTMIGCFPKVGIRPTIDGRMGGVRESLENQTMDLARSTATMISNNLKYVHILLQKD